MFIAKTILELQGFLERVANKKTALIPTMGSLHQGHVSLFKKAEDFAEIKIVTIFVNKTQFNNPEDFAKYPRQIEADLEILKAAEVDCVFIPDQAEIFPSEPSFKITPTALNNCLCGSTRPGHFEGVTLIITKFFNLIKPDFAIFGEKDFQQLALIKKLSSDLNFNVKIIGCETFREENGLAMSSRNQNLSEVGKLKAAEIFKVLNEIKSNPNLLQKKGGELLKNGFEEIDYLEIRDEENLNLVTNFDQKISSRIFIAVYLEKIRLIDNVAL
jgi:pantoate--beta-alanine ligase